MKPNLTRPLIIFDLETTGLDLSKDSIIQISYIKAGLDGSEVSRNIFINLCRSIPPLIQELTSITDEMVKTASKFKDISKEL